MESSLFKKTAPEIRNRIYELALAQPKSVHLIYSEKRGWQRALGDGTQLHILALTQVCKAVRSECTQLFYAVNSLTIRTGSVVYVPELLDGFRSRIGTLNGQALRDIIVELPRFVWRGGIWHGGPGPRDIQRRLTTLINVLQEDSVVYDACAFGARYSFEIHQQRRGGGYIREVVHGTLDVRNLVTSWQRILEDLHGRIEGCVNGREFKKALQFLSRELTQCCADSTS